MVKFTLIIAFLGLVALLSLAAIVLANAVMSKLFGQPIGGVVDWIRLIVANAVSACIPAVLAVRSNITIRFIGHIASKKVTLWLELLGALATWIVFSILVWQLQIYVLELISSGETTENLGMIIWPWSQSVMVLFGISLLVQSIVVVSIASAILGQRELSQFADAIIDVPDQGR